MIDARIAELERLLGGKFRISGVLGSGGMCTVYEAEHLATARPVAIKVLNKRSTATAIQRFQLEAKILAKLSHPNILSAYSVGITEDQQPFIVVEVLNGVNLADKIKQAGMLDWAHINAIMRQICAGVGYAHEQGIIHRDLKPSNIFITSNAEGEELVRILDFGIAAFSEGTPEQQLTQTGEVFGTPQYMSPEQCAGVRATRQSDIYALGCILYEMCTGAVPFPGDNAYNIMYKQIHDAIPEFLPQDASTPASVAAVLQKALAKYPEERYQTVEAFARDLERVDQGQVVKPAGRTKNTVRSRRAQIVALSISLTLVFAAIGCMTVPWVQRSIQLAIEAVLSPRQSPLEKAIALLKSPPAEVAAARKLVAVSFPGRFEGKYSPERFKSIGDQLTAGVLFFSRAQALRQNDPPQSKLYLEQSIACLTDGAREIDKVDRRAGMDVRLKLAELYQQLLPCSSEKEIQAVFDAANENAGQLAGMAEGDLSVAQKYVAMQAAFDLWALYPQCIYSESFIRDALKHGITLRESIRERAIFDGVDASEANRELVRAIRQDRILQRRKEQLKAARGFSNGTGR